MGHDWGGIVSWQFAFAQPEMVENLVILNLPHPNGLARELASNSDQQENSAYARRFIAGSGNGSRHFIWRADEFAKFIVLGL